MGQAVFIEDKNYFSSAFWHRFQNNPWGGFTQRAQNVVLIPVLQEISSLHDLDSRLFEVYNPFNRDIAHNQEAIGLIQDGQCQTVTVANVLNIVRESHLRARVIQQAVDALTPDGTAYFGIYEGDGSGIGKVTQYVKGVPTVWQENRRTEDYLSEIAPFFQQVTRRRNVITSTCPIKPLLNFRQYHDLLHQLPFGKRLPGATYIYRVLLHNPLQLAEPVAGKRSGLPGPSNSGHPQALKLPLLCSPPNESVWKERPKQNTRNFSGSTPV